MKQTGTVLALSEVRVECLLLRDKISVDSRHEMATLHGSALDNHLKRLRTVTTNYVTLAELRLLRHYMYMYQSTKHKYRAKKMKRKQVLQRQIRASTVHVHVNAHKKDSIT